MQSRGGAMFENMRARGCVVDGEARWREVWVSRWRMSCLLVTYPNLYYLSHDHQGLLLTARRQPIKYQPPRKLGLNRRYMRLRASLSTSPHVVIRLCVSLSRRPSVFLP